MRALCVLIILAAAAPARAEPNDELWVGGGARALRAPSARALTSDSLGGSTLGYARKAAALGPDLAVWVEGGLGIDTVEGAMFQSLATQIDAVALTAGLRLRYRLHRLIFASARFAAGAERVHVDVSGPVDSASDDAWGAMATAAVAVDAFIVARPGFGFGLRAELGYVMAQPRAITLHAPTTGDRLELPVMQASLGHLDLSGPAVGLAMVGQF